MPLPAPCTSPSGRSWNDAEIRVRYAETDQMGVVYYANYLVWFEVGRSEYCRRRGVDYRRLEKESQYFLAVAEVECRFHAPARYDDLLLIRTRIEKLKKRTVSFLYQVLEKENGTLLASGRSVHVLVDQQGRPVSFPPLFLKLSE